MALIRSAAYAVIFHGLTVFAVLGALLIAAISPRRLQRFALGWARLHSWCARTLLGISARIEGTPPTGPVLIAAKHQAAFETMELLLLLNEPAVVVKQELTEIPLWGRVAQKYGAIPIDRSGSAKALRGMLRAARAAVAEGRGILIFPEGTRVRPGEQPPLRAGFAGLYRQLDLPVVPVALDSGLVWPRGFVKQAGVITFRFGEPIPPGLPRAEAEARVHAAINALEN